MIRFLPKSLFGQLALILLSGLLLAQVLSFLLQYQDRGVRLFQVSGMQSAERIAEIVRLLDGEGAFERDKLVAIINVPPLRVSLSTPVWLDREKPVMNSPAGRFHKRLHQQLGEQFPIHVAVSELAVGSSSMEKMGQMGHMRQMQEMTIAGPEALVFLAQVQLTDGSWVTFENRISDEIFEKPTGLIVNIILIVGIILFVTLLAVKLATRPLSLLAEQADKLGKDINQAAMPETGSSEMRHASRALNTMQIRLQQFIADRARLLSAISHDLKTPITRMRLRSEMLEDAVQRESFIRNLDEMQAIATETLDFLRAADGSEKLQQVDICALLETIKQEAAELDQQFVISICQLKVYAGRPLALKRCLSNLIENAIKYGSNVAVVAVEKNDEIMISIIDSGPGIEEENLQAVFEPFFRQEISRNRDTGGTGLGLSIAKNIALSHGGDVLLENRQEGGLKATLLLRR